MTHILTCRIIHKLHATILIVAVIIVVSLTVYTQYTIGLKRLKKATYCKHNQAYLVNAVHLQLTPMKMTEILTNLTTESTFSQNCTLSFLSPPNVSCKTSFLV